MMPEPNLSFWQTELQIEDFGKLDFLRGPVCEIFFLTNVDLSGIGKK